MLHVDESAVEGEHVADLHLVSPCFVDELLPAVRTAGWDSNPRTSIHPLPVFKTGVLVMLTSRRRVGDSARRLPGRFAFVLPETFRAIIVLEAAGFRDRLPVYLSR